MLQFITQQNVLFYAMAALCVWGVISQLVLRYLYRGLMRDAVRPGGPKAKFMKQLRQRYQSGRRMRQSALNVPVFIRKNLMEYRFLGASLHGWARMGGAAMVLLALAGAAGFYLSRMPGAAWTQMQQNYILAAAAGEVLVALSYGLSDIGFCRNRLEVVLQDTLENSLTLHASGNEQILTAQQGDEIFAPEAAAFAEAGEDKEKNKTIGKMVSLPGRKKKNGKESASQKDKRELKQGLSRIKEGMRETAAASMESQKEKNARILREMDSAEQERVIREVLKEYL